MSRSLLLSSLLAVALAGVGCSKSSEGPPAQAHAATLPPRDPASARTLLAAGAAVVDVRTPEEFAAGALPRAANLPLGELTARLGDLEAMLGGDKTRPLVLYCASGARSKRAKQQLEVAGYTQVVNGGGIDELR